MKIRARQAAVCTLLAVIGALLAIVPARAQATGLFFPATGHHLTDQQGFLSFWRAHNGERLLGFPITEAAASDGATIQYFTRGRLEQRVDAAGAKQIATGSVGLEYAAALWKRFPPAPPRKPSVGERVFEASGRTLREPFLSFWQAAGGLEFFGAPISEVAWELTARGRVQVQYFERARLERDPQMAGTADEIQVGELGQALAALRGAEIAPLANLGYENYGPAAAVAPNIAPFSSITPTAVAAPAAPAAAPASQPAAVPAAPKAQPKPAPAPVSSAARRIVVNLSDQWLYAYEGPRQVFDAPVSSGRDGMETPTGSYSIYTKLKLQTMDGVTDGRSWVVPDVPNVMYINGGVALHGTYWHNRFGTGARLSHGCVNLPLDAAAWLYSWAPIGTTVQVTY